MKAGKSFKADENGNVKGKRGGRWIIRNREKALYDKSREFKCDDDDVDPQVGYNGNYMLFSRTEGMAMKTVVPKFKF